MEKPLDPQSLLLTTEITEIGVKRRRKYDPDRVSDDGFVYTPYIHRNGKLIRHPRGGVFKFPARKS